MKSLFFCFLLVLFHSPNPVQEKTILEIKYLHGDKRCDSCEKIERAVRKALNTHFPEQFREKQIIFTSINIDNEEHKGLKKKYEIWGSALILKATKVGKETITDISEIAHQNVNNEKQLVRLLKEEFEKQLK